MLRRAFRRAPTIARVRAPRPKGPLGDLVAVVEQWKPPHVGDDIEPERLVKLGGIMGDGEWRAAKNVTESPDWVGAAVADAFNLGRADGWKLKAKALIGELEWRGVIARRSVVGANRKPMPVFLFMGANPEAALTALSGQRFCSRRIRGLH